MRIDGRYQETDDDDIREKYYAAAGLPRQRATSSRMIIRYARYFRHMREAFLIFYATAPPLTSFPDGRCALRHFNDTRMHAACLLKSDDAR